MAGGCAFLPNAQEVLGDGVGNDDGLCDSGENCVYSPSIGAYQGENAGTDEFWAHKCVFGDGTSVTGVKLFGYPSLGR